ncbi:MAG: hypothetical protein DMD76_11215 [Candidatus Rokuibacteriota bacterium]|nr:MAG: hypothetical protein DMD76_11215 [Candidatus Rokubacteria bacterium]
MTAMTMVVASRATAATRVISLTSAAVRNSLTARCCVARTRSRSARSLTTLLLLLSKQPDAQSPSATTSPHSLRPPRVDGMASLAT